MALLTILDGNICILDCYYEKEKVKNIGAVWNKENKIWYMPFTASNLERCLNELNSPILDSNLEEELQKQKEKENKLKNIYDVSKKDAPITLKIPGIKLPLFNYQKHGVLFSITNNDGILIADEMGLGKSVQSLGVMLYGKYNFGWKKCLIVVPASLKYNWKLEIEKFTDESYVIIDGTAQKRLEQWKQDVYFYVVNYELITEDLFGGRNVNVKLDDDILTAQKKVKQINKQKQREAILAPIREMIFDCITIDEAHNIKSHKSKRSKNVKQLKAKVRIGLTGTPLDGKLEELHSVMQFIKPGLFEPKSRFMMKHAECDFFGKVLQYKNLDVIKDKLKPFYIRRLKKEVLKDLPDKIYENKYIELTKEERKIYDEIAKAKHEITEDAEAMVKVMRCKQFCNHSDLIDISCKKHSKLEMFLEIMDEICLLNCNKVVIFSQYKKMINILEKEIQKMGLKNLRIDGDTPKQDRADYQKIFNEDNSIDCILGTEAMSTGLNLTGATYVINYDDNWAPAIMRQREDRLHRVGQKNSVTVINFIVKDTIEERIRSVIYEKEVLSTEILGDDIDELVLKRLNPKDLLVLL